jgi:glyoxylase-like metal-dependent hydrolase (beta-lactamase superfamily II)
LIAVDRTVVFCGDLIEESGDPAIDADSDPVAWQETLDRAVAAAFIRRQQDWLRTQV